jgi:hypothetical protein
MRSLPIRAFCTVVFVAVLPAIAHAQPPALVEVATGDRIAGDVRRLQRGRLDFRTPAASTPGAQRWAGTISIVWSEVVRLTSTQTLEIELSSGERFTGSISSPAAGQLVVQTSRGPTRPIAMKDVVRIIRIEDGFSARTTASVDFGLTFANAENARTFTLNGDAEHVSPSHRYETRVAAASWLTARDDADRLTRNEYSVDVRRLLSNRWFALGKAQFQQDEPQELDFRFVGMGGIGRLLVHANRTLLDVRGGLDYDVENYQNRDSTDHSGELFGGLDWAWFEPGSSTEASAATTGFVSLTRSRFRLDVDGNIRRDVFWDIYWALNVHERYDSDPPGDRPRTDFGFSFSLGWTF